jgi:hypothetical protein
MGCGLLRGAVESVDNEVGRAAEATVATLSPFSFLVDIERRK